VGEARVEGRSLERHLRAGEERRGGDGDPRRAHHRAGEERLPRGRRALADARRRLRLVAEKTVSLLGQRAVVKAKEDVKIKGDKVYLA
jgi:hypothetical protein